MKDNVYVRPHNYVKKLKKNAITNDWGSFYYLEDIFQENRIWVLFTACNWTLYMQP